MKQQVTLTRQAIRTPRAAAFAGIIFSVLFTISMVLIRLALPEELRGTDVATWLQGNTTTISLALTLVPFAGIAFLWFMGVVRSRLGDLEDQFFSTVFFGSGLLFLAMMFASAAIAGGILGSYAIEADTLVKSGVVTFGRAIMYTIANVYGVRMAGVFMVSLATIWIRTHVMPRVFVFLTYALALVLLVSSNLTLWLVLVFPAWVFVISVFILIISLRGGQAEAEGVVGAQETSHMVLNRNHKLFALIYVIRYKEKLTMKAMIKPAPSSSTRPWIMRSRHAFMGRG